MPGLDVMTAARFYGPGEPLRIEQVPVPSMDAGDVLVRVAATGICGSDVHIAVEGFTPTGYLPITLGHEIAGIVYRVGAAVTGWAPGERVAVCGLVVDGTCDQCVGGHGEVCVDRAAIGISVDGGMAEYVAVPARNLCRLPDAVSFEVGAVATDAVATPFHALLDVARLSAGESIAIIGVGGLGLHAVQIAKLVGACPIIAIDMRASQRERAVQAGADLVIDSGGHSPVPAVLAATGNRGVDVAAEFVGHPDTITQAVAVLRSGGRAVIVGLGTEPMTVLPPVQFVRKQLQLLGSYGFTRNTIERVLQLVDAGQLDVAGSISHRFALGDANDALKTLHQKIGDPQRIVITNA